MLKDDLRDIVAKAPQLARSPWSWAAALCLWITADPTKDFFLAGKPLAVVLAQVGRNAQALSANPVFRLAMIPLAVFLFAMACRAVAESDRAARQRESIVAADALKPLRKIVDLFLYSQDLLAREWKLRQAREALVKTRNTLTMLSEKALSYTSRTLGGMYDIRVQECANLLLDIESDFKGQEVISGGINIIHSDPHLTFGPTGNSPGSLIQTRIFDPELNKAFLQQNEANCVLLEERMKYVDGRLKARRMKWEAATQEFRASVPGFIPGA